MSWAWVAAGRALAASAARHFDGAAVDGAAAGRCAAWGSGARTGGRMVRVASKMMAMLVVLVVLVC